MIPENPDAPADRGEKPEHPVFPADSGMAAAMKAERHAERVRSMRRHWRVEAHARAAGDAEAAQRAKDNGDRFFNELVDDLTRSLSRLSFAYLHDRDLIEDGVRELVVALYEKLRDLTETASRQGWETPQTFWITLKRFASNLFLRQVQKAHGRQRPRAGEAAEGEGTRPQREIRQSERPEAAVEAETRDEAAEEPFHALLDSDALRTLLNAIRDPRHRQALLWDAQGLPREEIRRRLEVSSLKTVYNYIQRARADVLAWAAAQGSDFSGWLPRAPGEDAFGSEGGRRPAV